MNAPPEMRRAPGSAPRNHDQNITDAKNTTLAAADKIHAAHAAVGNCLRDAVKHALLAGEELAKVQAGLPHGQWGPWLAENLSFSERTARDYTRLWNNRALIEANRQHAADSVRGALKLLAKPIEWEAKIGEAADVAPALDQDGHFFTINKDDQLLRVVHADEHPGHYTIRRCGIVRDAQGHVYDLADEEEVFRPLKADAIGFWLEQFGCARANTWLRVERQEVAAAA